MPSSLPAAVIWQPQGPLEWIHIALPQLHVINEYVELLSLLISRGHQCIIHITGKEPDFLLLSMLSADKVQTLFNNNLSWPYPVFLDKLNTICQQINCFNSDLLHLYLILKPLLLSC